MKFLYAGGLVLLLALSVQVAVAETTTTYDAAGNIIQTTSTETTDGTGSSSGSSTGSDGTTKTTTDAAGRTTDSTTDEKPTVCTADYTPVCGEVQVQCVTTPCNPVQETFSNMCNLEARGAKFLYTGECKRADTTTDTGSTKVDDDDEGDVIDTTTVEREMKESGEKGGTTDINIGVGELTGTDTAGARTVQTEIVSLSLSGGDDHKDWIIIESTTGETQRINKADLIDALANSSDGGLRAAFIKIGDIKGEAMDDATPEDDGTAARASKPKEIVVVGSKVRDEDIPFPIQWGGTGSENAAPDSFFDIWVEAVDPTAATTADSFFDIFVDAGEDRNTVPDSFFDIFVDVSGEDVALQALSVAQTHEDVEEVEVLEDEVRVTYDESMRLFGFIPLQGTRTVVVDTSDPSRDDRVKVQFPWWRFLATTQTDVESLSEAIETELDATIPVVPVDDRPTEEVAFYYNKIQAQVLQTLSNIAK